MARVTSIDAARENRKLCLSSGATRTTRRAKQSRITWAMFVDKIREPVRTKETYKEYLRLPKAQQDEIKDVGWFVGGRLRDGVRKKANLESRDLLTLDIDFAGEGWELDLDLAYGDFTYAVYSTHKHCDSSPRLRLIFPLSRSVSADEYPAIARMVASRWDIEVFDDTTYQASRVMYWPSCSSDGDFVFAEGGNVGLLDPDVVLAEYADWRDIASWPVSSRQDRAIEQRVDKAADPWEKPGIIGDFCRAYPIETAIAEYLSDVYVPGTTEGRYTFTGGSTSNGAIVYNDGRYLYSNHGTDPAGGHSVNAFDLVRIHKFSGLDEKTREDITPSKRPSWKAMLKLINEDTRVAEARVADLLDDDFDDTENEVEDEFGLPITRVTEPSFEFTDEDREALKNLQRNEDGSIQNHITNAQIILAHDPKLKGAIAYNEFQQDYVQRRSLPGKPLRDPVNGDLWSDRHDSWVVAHVHAKYEIELPGFRISHALNNVGEKNSFHPVRNYLNGLKWDGKPRLDTLLIDLLKADDTAYTRAVTRKTLVAAVKRIFEPGAKFDTLLILEGLQGVGKSSFLDSLARGWFTDNVGSMGKDSVENLKGKWVGEIAELAHFKKAEVEHVKAFLSRRTDRMREAYGRRSMDFPRQSICIGTTNDEEYLKDDQNRRFWPVRCRASELVRLSADIVDQVWAEAIRLYRAGESVFLDSADLITAATSEQQRRQSDRDVVEELKIWLDLPDSTDDDFDPLIDDEEPPKTMVTVQMIWSEFMQCRGKPDTVDRAKIKKLMRMMPGWSHELVPRKLNGKSERVFTRETTN